MPIASHALLRSCHQPSRAFKTVNGGIRNLSPSVLSCLPYETEPNRSGLVGLKSFISYRSIFRLSCLNEVGAVIAFDPVPGAASVLRGQTPFQDRGSRLFRRRRRTQ